MLQIEARDVHCLRYPTMFEMNRLVVGIARAAGVEQRHRGHLRIVLERRIHVGERGLLANSSPRHGNQACNYAFDEKIRYRPSCKPTTSPVRSV